MSGFDGYGLTAISIMLPNIDRHYRLEHSKANTNPRAMHSGTTGRQDWIEENGLGVTNAARIFRIDGQTLSSFLNARSGISREIAVRLERAFGTSAREWLIPQLACDLTAVMRRADKITVGLFRATVQRVTKRRGEA